MNIECILHHLSTNSEPYGPRMAKFRLKNHQNDPPKTKNITISGDTIICMVGNDFFGHIFGLMNIKCILHHLSTNSEFYGPRMVKFRLQNHQNDHPKKGEFNICCQKWQLKVNDLNYTRF